MNKFYKMIKKMYKNMSLLNNIDNHLNIKLQIIFFLNFTEILNKISNNE